MNSPGTNPEEWLRRQQERTAEILQKSQAAQADLAANHVEFTSEDGFIKLKVNASGALESLEISPRASAARVTELGPMIMRTYQQARSQASARMLEIISEFAGPNSVMLDKIKKDVPPPPDDGYPGMPTQPPPPQTPRPSQSGTKPPPKAEEVQDDDDGFDGIKWEDP